MTTHKGRNYLSNGIKRTALSIALGACFVGGVHAQSAVGSVFGQTEANASVTIENPATGTRREITAGADGRFTFSQLPPGRYKVTTPAGTKEVVVNVGTGTPVVFAAAGDAGVGTLDTVTVVGAGAVNPIDVSSVESSTVFTEEVIDRLPVARNVAAVALLAPGTVRTDIFGGNAISFGGASAAENAYYVNGFNVTNIRSGLAYNEVPFEGIAEMQVKTGGYGAEFGRSLGGVTNVITKRGTNEWKFGVGVEYTPDWGRSYYRRATAVNNQWQLVESKNKRDDVIYTASAGGPIIKDRLFFYGLYQANKTERDVYGTQNAAGTQNGTRSEARENDDGLGLVKLDWNITDNHLLEVTAFRDRTEEEVTSYNTHTPWGKDRYENIGTTTLITGGDSYSARWTGYITDTFTLSALYGKGEYINTAVVPNTDCPFVFDNRDSRQHGCAVAAAYSRDDNGDTRKAYRVDGEWVLGDHTLRFGVDVEKINSIDMNVSSGGLSYTVDNVGDVDLPPEIEAAIPPGTTTIVSTREFANGGEFDTENKAWYIEDRWQITEKFMAYLGFRSESFKNMNADGVTFVEVTNTKAPRLGFSWDVNGDSTFKVFGNAGRYYIPIMTNTNVRLSGAETDIQRYYAADGTFAGGQFDLPNLGALLGTVVQSNGQAGNPLSVVDPNLEPLYQDEYILGAQTQLSESWTAGLRTVYRKMNAGMDDYCAYQRPHDWALANGYTADEAETIGTATSHCFLMNPGSDLTMNVDLDGAGPEGLTQIVIPNSVLGLPTPTRTYKAIEFFFERAWDDKWTLQGSYTWSKSYGNSEGYVKSDIAQDDAGITQDFDFAELMEHSYGLLPNDRRHALKLFGAYRLTDEWTVGANLLLQSGRPKNCFGNYAGNAVPEDPTLYPNSSFYCNGQPSPRGTRGFTDWTRTVGLQIAYQPNWAEGLRFGFDVLNLFDEDNVTAIRERESPAARYGQPIAWQAPRSMRFTISYDFDL